MSIDTPISTALRQHWTFADCSRAPARRERAERRGSARPRAKGPTANVLPKPEASRHDRAQRLRLQRELWTCGAAERAALLRIPRTVAGSPRRQRIRRPGGVLRRLQGHQTRRENEGRRIPDGGGLAADAGRRGRLPLREVGAGFGGAPRAHRRPQDGSSRPATLAVCRR